MPSLRPPQYMPPNDGAIQRASPTRRCSAAAPPACRHCSASAANLRCSGGEARRPPAPPMKLRVFRGSSPCTAPAVWQLRGSCSLQAADGADAAKAAGHEGVGAGQVRHRRRRGVVAEHLDRWLVLAILRLPNLQCLWTLDASDMSDRKTRTMSVDARPLECDDGLSSAMRCAQRWYPCFIEC